MPILKISNSQKLRKKLQRVGVDARNLESWCNALGRTSSEILCLSDAELLSRLKRLVEYIQQHQAIERPSSMSASDLGRTNSDYSYVSMQSCPMRLLAGGPRGLDDTWSDDEKDIEISRPPPQIEYYDSDDSFQAMIRRPMGNTSTPMRPDSPGQACPMSPRKQNLATTNTMQGLPTPKQATSPAAKSAGRAELGYHDEDDSFEAMFRSPKANTSTQIRPESPGQACPMPPRKQNLASTNTMQGLSTPKKASSPAAKSPGRAELDYYDEDDSFEAMFRSPKANTSTQIRPESPGQACPMPPRKQNVVSTNTMQGLSTPKKATSPVAKSPGRAELDYYDEDDSFAAFIQPRSANQSASIRSESPAKAYSVPPTKQNLTTTNTMQGLATPKQATAPIPATPASSRKPRWLEDSWNEEKQREFERNKRQPQLEFSDSDTSLMARTQEGAMPVNTMQRTSTPRQLTSPAARTQGTVQQAAAKGARATPHSRSFVAPRRLFDDAPERRNQTTPGMNRNTLNRSAQQEKLQSMVQSFEKAVDDFKRNTKSPSAPPRPSLPYQYPVPLPPSPYPAGPYQYPLSRPPPQAVMPYQSPPHIPDYEMGYHTFFTGARVPESTTVEQMRRPTPLQYQPYRSFWDEFPSNYLYPTSPTLGGPQPMIPRSSLGPMQPQPGPFGMPMPPGACGADSGVPCCTCSEGDGGVAQNATMGGPGGGVAMGPVGPPGSPVRPPGSPVQPAGSSVRPAGSPVQPARSPSDAASADNANGGVVNISLIGEEANSFTVPLPRGVMLSIQVP